MKKERRPQSAASKERKTKSKQKFVILLQRDTGFCFDLPANTPVDRLPDGSHILPYVGSQAQIQRKIQRFNLKPSLLQKFAVL
jgi:hypothetical protein